MKMLTHISVKLVNLASAIGNSPVKAFEDRTLKEVINSVKNTITWVLIMVHCDD